MPSLAVINAPVWAGILQTSQAAVKSNRYSC